ncbi:MAG TPA: hypothetical protein VNN73_17995 [Blastocatellia bacterium]|nr:hypothetical protein [Blastocatellia bacterium]
MTSRFYPEKHIRNARVARPVSGRIFVWLAIIAMAGALLSAGFIMSGRQHFEAVTIGYESEDMRQQAIGLEEKLRQLELEYARVSSPLEMERAAQHIGLQRPDTGADSIRRPINAEDKKKKAKPKR